MSEGSTGSKSTGRRLNKARTESKEPTALPKRRKATKPKLVIEEVKSEKDRNTRRSVRNRDIHEDVATVLHLGEEVAAQVSSLGTPLMAGSVAAGTAIENPADLVQPIVPDITQITMVGGIGGNGGNGVGHGIGGGGGVGEGPRLIENFLGTQIILNSSGIDGQIGVQIDRIQQAMTTLIRNFCNISSRVGQESCPSVTPQNTVPGIIGQTAKPALVLLPLPKGQDPGIFPSAVQLRHALAQYGRAIALRSADHTRTSHPLTELDAWLTDRDGGLLGKITSALPVTKADMTAVMRWTLSRGKWRINLVNLIESNADALVAESTSAALAVVRDARDDVSSALLALRHACVLKGVGPTTASALLTLQPPHLLPFMSDEAASFFSPTLGPIKYTKPFYAKFAHAMDAEVRRLNVQSDGDDHIWDGMSLERALFAIFILRKHGEDGVLEPEANP